jgi:hypothetical protein
MTRVRWDSDGVLKAIRTWTVRRGRAPTMTDWKRATASTPGSTTVEALFGSWSAAITAALGDASRGRCWNCEVERRLRGGLCAQCRAYARNKGHLPIPQAETVRETKRRIVEQLLGWAAKYGAPPTGTDWTPFLGKRKRGPRWKEAEAERDRRRSETPWTRANTCATLFGSWHNALRAAGLDVGEGGEREEPRLHGHWTDEEILDAMLRWREERGEWPTSAEWRRSTPTTPAYTTVAHRFGGLREARREAARLRG